MPKHVVSAVGAFPPGTRKLLRLGGRSIAVFNVDGSFYALRNQCPHGGGPLGEGAIVGRLSATLPGAYSYDAGAKLLKCPWHRWEFDLRTGQSWFDPVGQRVRNYAVTVEPGERMVEECAHDGPPGALPGPYVAETIKVTVEDDYVVVEV